MRWNKKSCFVFHLIFNCFTNPLYQKSRFLIRNFQSSITGSKHFLWIASSVVDTAAVKTLLANGPRLCPVKRNPVFNNGPKILLKSPPGCLILCN